MISYDLAKELREAGFPQKKDYKTPERFRVLCVEHGQLDVNSYCAECGFVYVPSLEELIEACAPRWIDLYGYSNSWNASPNTALENKEIYEGSSPTEAVARLWLALNKKQ